MHVRAKVYMKKRNSNNLNIQVGEHPRVLVVTDIQCEEVFNEDMVMSYPEGKLFMKEAKICGFAIEDFIFINPCPPVDGEEPTDSVVGKHLSTYHDEFQEQVDRLVDRWDIRMVVTLGKWAIRQYLNAPTLITKVRGTVQDHNGITLLPLLSPREVLRFPDRRETYNTDLLQLKSLEECGWDVDQFREDAQGDNYEWCLDIQHLLDNPPAQIAFDTETVGLEFRSWNFRVLTASITSKKGESLVIPLDIAWWNDETLFSEESAALPRLTTTMRRKLLRQLRELLANPNVHVVGHNLKYDIHVMHSLGIEIANWYADTIQLAFLVDENMKRKDLDECVRRWLPQFAGYADEFNAMTDKSRMDKVEHGAFIKYAGGDTDVTYRLAGVLIREGEKDSRQWETFTKIQMPALRTFVQMERRGVRIDTNALRSLAVELATMESELFTKLVEDCPPKLLRKYAEAGKKISFDSPDFLTDLLFGEDGIQVKDGEVVNKGGRKLIPCVFTKGGKPSTSGGDHLPYFEDVTLVQNLMAYKKVSKMRSTYVGEEGRVETKPIARLKNGGFPKPLADAFTQSGIILPKSTGVRRRTPYPELVEKLAGAPNLRMHTAKSNVDIIADAYANAYYENRIEASGFWQYIADPTAPRIHPSFWLHRTVTGRTSSSNPNFQNIPKRGELAKAYRKIFVPSEGFLFAEVDLSQAELRVAACMANETEMIRIYQEGGDIHSATAAATMRVSEAKFNEGLDDETTILADVVSQWPGADVKLRELTVPQRRLYTVAQFCDFKRFAAKAVNFGFLYGMGWRKFKTYAKTDYGIVFTDEEAQETRELFFKKYPRLQRWHDAMREFLRDHGFVRALHGSLRRLPNIESDDDMIVGMSSRQGINSPVQRFASDLGLIAANRFTRDASEADMRILMFIHDANIVEAGEAVIDEAASALRFYMETTPLDDWFDLRLPVNFEADIATGPNLSEMRKRKDLLAVEPAWFRSGERSPDPLAEDMVERWAALVDYGVITLG